MQTAYASINGFEIMRIIRKPREETCLDLI